MTALPDQETHAKAGAGLTSALRSSGVTQFRRNPFRLLRLSVGIRSEDAVWSAEKILALRRAGLPPPAPDLLPWLPDADELDIQEAAQKIEEPLRRMVDQLLWFDLEGDPGGAALMHALITNDGAALSALLRVEPPLTPDVEVPLTTIASALNLANLALVTGFSALHGTGPFAEPSRGDVTLAAPNIPWSLPAPEAPDAPRTATDVHKLVGSQSAAATYRWPNLLARAYRSWNALLRHPALHEYLRLQIDALGDELLRAEDEETIRNAVATLLADLVSAEIKRAMTNGQDQTVAELTRLAAASGFDPQVWSMAFRPLRPLFAAELRELDALIESSDVGLDSVMLYLGRLSALRKQWSELDAAGLIGLNSVADDALLKVFQVLSGSINPAIDSDRYADAIRRAAALAQSKSLEERINGLRTKFEQYRKVAFCAFCDKREQDSALAVVLTGQKITGVERHFNSTTTHYSLRAAPVGRCAPCADFHDLLRSSKRWCWALAVVYPAAALFFAPKLLLLAVTVSVILAFAASMITERLMYRASGGNTRKIRVKDSASWQAAVNEGYSYQRTDFRRDAVAKWSGSARAGQGVGRYAGLIIWLVIMVIVGMAQNC